ncbi:helix-turn-helix transcriptional regulator [Streptomyces olivoreticuli]|uniref:helix-turn-helix domain-containing protein n=1 Tax=Streptomyces olivoreticuli TaxID=68246 RepID=UPI0026584E8B|nr:helix-turn-helix transcriptional regulator [Streptomyces olivoreticuli]WKK21733.1 helix-turn-helix transcriptional regulator [Streptomyces olivoreticuli]
MSDGEVRESEQSGRLDHTEQRTTAGEEAMGHSSRRTARRRRLGSELRALREAARVSTEEAATAIHGDKTKISRQETGVHRVTRLELEVLLNLYKAEDGKQREWLIALSSEGNKRSWWSQHGPMLPDGFKELLTLEADAARITAFQTQVIPGPLQTQEYATAVISGACEPLTDERLNFFVDFRMSRQSIFLRGNPPQYLGIIMEGVLHHRVGGPKVMADQLRHLVAMCQSPNLSVLVVPFSQSSFTETGGSFALYSYPDALDLDVVQVEHLDGALCLEEDGAVSKYRKTIEKLQSSALSPQQSIELISAIAQKHEHE